MSPLLTDLLTDHDLAVFCKQLKIKLNGILQSDLFDKLTHLQNGAYIINLQSSKVGNGTHWTALYITQNYAVYFDSFGLPIPTAVLKAISRSNKKTKKTIIYSTDQIQTMKSIRCGYFCLYFLYFFQTKYQSKYQSKYQRRLDLDAKTILNQHNSVYSLKHKHLNDKILQKLIRNLFI